MVTGRKLLLADDSVTIQKVVDLTFTDEGLEVVTVSDGQQALEKLEEFSPDIVLADVFMPKVNGYELCERIKRSDRFGHIPVMLLVGSFEPFDEAEARRVGADDYLTKPFQSIRTLIGKVRNLLTGGGSAQPSEATTQRLAPPVEAEKENRPDSDFLERSTADTAPLPDVNEGTEHAGHLHQVSFADLSMDDQMIEETHANDYSGVGQSKQTVQYSAADLKDAGISQTVESEQAPEPETVGATVGAFAPAQAGEQSHAAAANQAQAAPQSSAAASSEDALLDLGEFESPSTATDEADDFFLDLFDETPQPYAPAAQSFEAHGAQPSVETPSAIESGAVSTVEEKAEEPQAQEFVEGQVLGVEEQPASSPVEAEAATFAEPIYTASETQGSTQQAYTSETHTASTERLPEGYKVEEAPSTSKISEPSREAQPSESAAPHAGQISLDQLSPEVIDAIARRAVEQLSERVVEQVAWEVVPALAELLIKRRLEENSGQ